MTAAAVLALAVSGPMGAALSSPASGAGPAVPRTAPTAMVPANPAVASYPATLWSVAADSPTDVWAVGYTGDGCCNSTPLAEHWNGKRWSSSTPREVPGQEATQLYGVTVLGPRNVWAVGSSSGSDGSASLAEHWNGKKWKIVDTPNPEGSTTNGFNAMSGDSPDDLWAVGLTYDPSTFGYVAFAEHWDGSQWSLSAPISPGGSGWSPLRGVATTSAGPIAVGEYQTAVGGYDGLAEQYAGGEWTQMTTPLPKKAVVSSLFGIAAAGAGDSYAVGCWSQEDLFCGVGGQQQKPLVERLHAGAWHRLKVRLPEKADAGGFDAVSVVPGSSSAGQVGSVDGWAVGESTTDGVGKPWLAHLRGDAWTSVRSPELSGNSYLGGVLTLSPTDAWIVGATDSGTLAEHWNGRKWKVVKTAGL